MYIYGIAVDNSGNIYVSEVYSNTIAVFPPLSSGLEPYILTGFQGQGYIDGPLSSARFSAPAGLVLDGSGNLYVVEASNQLIRKINLISQEVTTFAGTAYSSSFLVPQYISYDGIGKFYVSSLSNPNAGIRVASNGQITSIPPTAQFTPTTGIVVAVPDGSIYYYSLNTAILYQVKYVNTNYELLCEKGANGPQGPAGPQGPISPITIVVANNVNSAQPFSRGDKGNTYIITSNSNTFHNIISGTLDSTDAGFYVYLRNGNPKTGYNIIIYKNWVKNSFKYKKKGTKLHFKSPTAERRQASCVGG
jgi:hypothetical protein